MATTVRTKLRRLIASASNRSNGSISISICRQLSSATEAAEAVGSRGVVGLGVFGLKDYEDYRRSLYGDITHKALLVDAAGTLLVPSQPMAQVMRMNCLFCFFIFQNFSILFIYNIINLFFFKFCRYIERLERSMVLPTLRLRYWTDTEGLMSSHGEDLVSGPFYFHFLQFFYIYLLHISYCFFFPTKPTLLDTSRIFGILLFWPSWFDKKVKLVSLSTEIVTKQK